MRLQRIIGEDAAFRAAVWSLRCAAASNVPVWLEGERGTGRELFARTLHALSSRRQGPFVAVHCGAIRPVLLERTLLGSETRAPNGVAAGRCGRFELAHGGTLFLKDMDVLPPTLRERILHAVEEKRFRRPGGIEERDLDVRVVGQQSSVRGAGQEAVPERSAISAVRGASADSAFARA